MELNGLMAQHTDATNHTEVKIALDAMGGDHAPHEIVKGAVLGSITHQVTILLVGQPDIIEKELAALDTEGARIQVIPAADVIEMDDDPLSNLRKKRNSSIAVTAQMIKKGEAQGMIAAGSTGAAVAAGVLYVGRIKGVPRPAIAVVLPSVGKPSLLLDAGANYDCTPETLVHFARMGNAFMTNFYAMEHPRVGILNIGEEMGKGNAQVNEAYGLLEADPSLNFIGNVEANDPFLGRVDVAVCDGFVGNVALKSAEGICKMLLSEMKDKLSDDFRSKLGALLAKPALQKTKKRVDPDEYGGALLLGINGICVIAHGSSNAHSICNAIRVAKTAIQRDVLGKMTGSVLKGTREGTPSV